MDVSIPYMLCQPQLGAAPEAWPCSIRDCPQEANHKLPDSDLRQRFLWIEVIRMSLGDRNWKPDGNSRICNCHFTSGEPSEDPNAPDYVPSLLPGYELPIQRPAVPKALEEALALKSNVNVDLFVPEASAFGLPADDEPLRPVNDVDPTLLLASEAGPHQNMGDLDYEEEEDEDEEDESDSSSDDDDDDSTDSGGDDSDAPLRKRGRGHRRRNRRGARRRDSQRRRHHTQSEKRSRQDTGTYCSMLGCGFRSGRDRHMSFHRVPHAKDPERRYLWTEVIRISRKDPAWNAGPNSRICSQHFVSGKPSRKREDVDYVPSIVPGLTEPVERPEVPPELASQLLSRGNNQSTGNSRARSSSSGAATVPKAGRRRVGRPPGRKNHVPSAPTKIATCCVLGCGAKSYKEKDVHFFRFPHVNKVQLSLWVEVIGRMYFQANIDWRPTMNSWICARHFAQGRPSRDLESEDFVPSILSNWAFCKQEF